jgi:hypothetical protein
MALKKRLESEIRTTNIPQMSKRMQEIALGDFRTSILASFFTFGCFYFPFHAQRERQK